ncbi:MAG: shikimate dehydrogenase [Sulfuricurvum sp.]|jgi:shikimate dehydrogenase|uniref:shikimate dehydrogenase n=1 Tax=Sulfuricurvum sp. TaxID=2025608 RepID=UPI0025E12A70|nr:shikimate dehydrogenase [Sulfuricurvum sp.]MCK9374326.1 shikimate dehydrogenase [Sulfuricurvum sp.]
MKIFTIFGDPIEHSRSPLMHNSVFKALGVKACYTRSPLRDGSKLRDVFFAKALSGANVTVPHKEAAYLQCDEVRGIAQKIQAVNTLINENGKLIGYNTDADGFINAIQPFGPIQNALILGAGGTARALATVLRQEGITPTILNRSSGRLNFFRENGFSALCWDEFTAKPYDLIINTTSAGLSDDELPLPRSLLKKLLAQTKGAVDVIYGKETPFLQEVKILALPYKDGSDMLLEQGLLANHLFLNKLHSVEQIRPLMQKSFLY